MHRRHATWKNNCINNRNPDSNYHYILQAFIFTYMYREPLFAFAVLWLLFSEDEILSLFYLSIFFQSYVRIATFKRLRNMHIIINNSKIKYYIKMNNKKVQFFSYLFIYLFFSRSDLKKLILKKLRFRELPNDSSSEVLSNLGLYQFLITFNVIIMKIVCHVRQSHY